MLDIRRIKENPEEVKRLLKAKEVDCDEAVDKILELDLKHDVHTSLEVQTEVDLLGFTVLVSVPEIDLL